MKKKSVIGLCLTIFATLCQLFSQTDSLKTPIVLSQKTAFLVSTDMRETFVKNSAITIYGGYLGLRLANQDVYSLGFYKLTNSAEVKLRNRNQEQNPTQPTLVNQEVSLWFISSGYTHTLYDGKIFKIDAPVEIGAGAGSSGIYDADDKLLKLTKNTIFPIQGGISTIVKLNAWFGIRVQGGYRELIGKSLFQREYSGWYYTYGLSLDFEAIFKKLKKKNVKNIAAL